MSKKSTSRTGNDENTNDSRTNGGSSCSYQSKCDLLQNLPCREEGTSKSDGDCFSSTHKVLTPNSESPLKNHATPTLSNTYKSDSASDSSLDDGLYGTSDAFNKNLEYLRNRLQSLQLVPSDKNQNICLDSDLHSYNSDNNYNNRISNEGYLSTRETYINISSPFENYKLREKFKDYSGMRHLSSTRSMISTIYEAPETYESDKATTDSSYSVPEKRICLRDSEKNSEIALTPSPRSLDLNKQFLLDLPLEGSSISPSNSVKALSNSSKQTCEFSPVLKTQLTSTEAVALYLPLEISSKTSSEAITCSSEGTSINYQVPIKKKCIRDKTPTFTISKITEVEEIGDSAENIEIKPILFSRTVWTQCIDTECSVNNNETGKAKEFEEYLIHIIPPSEGEDNSARTVQIIEDHDQEINNDGFLYLDFPSAIIDVDMYSSSAYPIEPNIRIIDTSDGETNKRRRKNRISPVIKEIDSSRTSSAAVDCNSVSDYSNDRYASEEHSVMLDKKYYEDTSEISSNINSTPPCAVSTNVSDSSRYPSAISESTRSCNSIKTAKESSKRSRSTVKSRSATDFETHSHLNYVNSRAFDPFFCASLDIPKISNRTYIYPALTRITSFSGNFTYEGYSKDCHDFNDESRLLRGLYTKSGHCYKAEGEVLLDSSATTPLQNKLETEVEKKIIDDVAKVTNKTNSPRKKLFQDRLAFRKKQSTDMSFYCIPSDITLNQEFSENSKSSGIDDDVNEVNASCCCFKIFFSKKNTQCFT